MTLVSSIIKQFIEGIDKALEEIGFGSLGRALGVEEVKERMREVAEEIQKAGGDANNFSNKFKVLKAGISEAGNNLVKTLKDPLTATLFVVTEMVEALKDVDAGAGKMAKNFGVSFHEALHLKGEMNSIAGSTSDVNITTGKLVETFTTLNTAFGTFASLSEEDKPLFGNTLQYQFQNVQNSRLFLEEAWRNKIFGFKPPEDNFDPTTINAVIQNGMSYFLGNQFLYRLSPVTFNDLNFIIILII